VQLEQIKTNVFNFFGVNEDILQNKAIGDNLDAFFDGCIEPFSVQLADVMTRMTFSKREQATGNKVVVLANKLQYMSTSSKISMAKELGDRGILMIDEIRELFNYEPLPDEQGQHCPVRGEYYLLDKGKTGDGTGDEKNEEEEAEQDE